MAKWGEGDPRWIVEERPDATNVNNWHWSEKNACRWSQTKLQELLNTFAVDNSAASCLVTEVSKCEGEAMVNNRKGKLIYFYEWDIELKWKSFSKEDEKKTAQGKVSIPNMSEENTIDEVEVLVTAEDSSDFTMACKKLMMTEGAKVIREKLSEYLEALKNEFSQGLILPSKDNVDKKKTTLDKPSSMPVAPKVFKPGDQNQLTGAVRSLSLDTASFSVRQSLCCPLNEAYKCFVDPKMVEAFTHGPVVMDPKVNGKFELFNGNITGEFIELENNKRVKQYWRIKSWPANHNSVVELNFEETDSCTIVHLKQSEIPYSDLDATKAGWDQYYWQAIKMTFGFGSFLADIL